MNPDDVVLVALINNARDFDIVQREHWYRIPARHAPKFFNGAQYLAFYFSRAFGEDKWAISRYAPVRGHELARRRDLLPEEPDHPRAEELYYKLQLGAIEKREPPIVSKRGRRILFLWTTWEKFSNARELNDLFHKGPAQDNLWEALRESQLDAEREIFVREGEARYRVDFLIYCPRGRVAVSIGPEKAGVRSRKDFRALAISEDDLEHHFERALDQIKAQARELGEHYLTTQAQMGAG
jgi:hypothetical protein